MGCGHSKINIYPRKYRGKANSRKSVAPEKTDKAEIEEKENQDLESDINENSEDSDAKKTIKVKPFGGPLLAQAEISTSQQDFFKMLDEKIENGPDYNSESETEKVAESMRLSALLKDWETASANSRSLPATPKRKSNKTGLYSDKKHLQDTTRALASTSASAELARDPHSDRPHISQIPQSVIQQSYGMNQIAYKQVSYNSPAYFAPNPSNQMAYPSAMQYQAISPMYIGQPVYPPAAPMQPRQYATYASPAKTYANSAGPKQYYYDQPPVYNVSPKIYASPGPSAKTTFSNGELLQQQQLFAHHQMQYQQYKDPREQALVQHQQQAGYRSPRTYEPGVSIPIVVPNQPTELNALHRKQYELT